jgi:transposase
MRIDGRTLPREATAGLRRMAVQRVREGERPSDVIRSYGLSPTSIYPWLRAACRRGLAGVARRPAPGRPSKLTPTHRALLRRWLDGYDPRHYGFQSALSTRPIVVELLHEKLGVTLDVTTVGCWLHRLGITPQQPLRRAYERDPEAIQTWLDETYPALLAAAKSCGA